MVRPHKVFISLKKQKQNINEIITNVVNTPLYKFGHSHKIINISLFKLLIKWQYV